jgi:hypothetical protein
MLELPVPVQAALVAALVSALGVLVSAVTARWQAALKLKELEDTARRFDKDLDARLGTARQDLDARIKIAREEIDTRLKTAREDIATRNEAARQTQMTEVLKKRIETYPELYRIISAYGRAWELSDRPWDLEWCETFLSDLLRNNEKNGAFFSNKVYESYGDLRGHLESLRSRLRHGGHVTDEDIEKLYAIIRGPIKPSGDSRGPGLGSWMKNELGAEVETFTSVLHGR